MSSGSRDGLEGDGTVGGQYQGAVRRQNAGDVGQKVVARRLRQVGKEGQRTNEVEPAIRER